MKKYFYILSLLLLISCKSIELPTIEESNYKINLLQKQIEVVDKTITPKMPKTNTDLTLKIKRSAVQKIVKGLAQSSMTDFNLFFQPTPQFIKEEHSFFGISYTDYLSIDTGFVELNLRDLDIQSMDYSVLKLHIELDGKGFFDVSGKYKGIPASKRPEIELNLSEDLQFSLYPNKYSEIVIAPYPKTMYLNVKFLLNFMGWKIPWNESIDLNLTDILQPVKLPMSLSSDIDFPFPKKEYDFNTIEPVKYSLNFKDTKISIDNNILNVSTNILLIKKNK